MTDNNDKNTTTGAVAANDGDNATISVSKAVMRSAIMCDILSSLSDEDRTAASTFIEQLLGDFDSILTAYKAMDAPSKRETANG